MGGKAVWAQSAKLDGGDIPNSAVAAAAAAAGRTDGGGSNQQRKRQGRPQGRASRHRHAVAAAGALQRAGWCGPRGSMRAAKLRWLAVGALSRAQGQVGRGREACTRPNREWIWWIRNVPPANLPVGRRPPPRVSGGSFTFPYPKWPPKSTPDRQPSPRSSEPNAAFEIRRGWADAAAGRDTGRGA